jgi:hypothetical protein
VSQINGIGKCTYTCNDSTLTYCTGPNACVNTNTDRNNCGSCANVCPAGLTCVSGHCIN